MDTKFAPYAPPSAVIGVIRFYRGRDVPERIAPVTLQQIGVTESLTTRTTAALRFLDLMREDGTTTDKLRAIRYASEDDYHEVLGGILDAAYRDVLNVLDLSTATEREISNAFIPYSPAGQRDRMIVLFVALAREAGWEVAAQPKAAGDKAPPKRPRPTSSATTTLPRGRRADKRGPDSPPPAPNTGGNGQPSGGSLLFGVTDADIAALGDGEFDEVWAALGKVARARARQQQLRSKGSAIGRKLRSGRRTGIAVEFSRDEARIMFDRTVRRELHISGDEFLRRLDAGDLPDSPVVEYLALLAGGARTRV